MARKKGSRNKGYWYRTGRGWYVGMEKLFDDSGRHIKDLNDKQAAELAYHKLMAVGRKPEPKQAEGYTVREVCREYLKEAKVNAAPSTYAHRKIFLFDFCEGKKGVHKGYGNLLISELIGLHVKQWLDSHNWLGSRRMAFQALRRAIFYGIGLGMVKENPLKGFKVDPVRKRRAYFDKATEEALYRNANRALRDLLRALIGTGCRPGEIIQLERRHIEERDGRMYWRFKPNEHKTGKKTNCHYDSMRTSNWTH